MAFASPMPLRLYSSPVYEWMHTTRVSRVSVVVRVKRGGESKGVQVLRNLMLAQIFPFSYRCQITVFIRDNYDWSHGLAVRTLDSESSNPSSNLGGTFFLLCAPFYFLCFFPFGSF